MLKIEIDRQLTAVSSPKSASVLAYGATREEAISNAEALRVMTDRIEHGERGRTILQRSGRGDYT